LSRGDQLEKKGNQGGILYLFTKKKDAIDARGRSIAAFNGEEGLAGGRRSSKERTSAVLRQKIQAFRRRGGGLSTGSEEGKGLAPEIGKRSSSSSNSLGVGSYKKKKPT